ncbi:MAG: penicillin acylase family protein, partial [Chloroflexota bacterium]|nr:penicillin acylase family protein [Chloroflexota bacterium]
MSFLPDFSSCSRALLRLLLGSRLPRTGGVLDVEGLRGPVTIRRDRYGIPMIEAEDELDVFFGFGFCQGQDRAVQI